MQALNSGYAGLREPMKRLTSEEVRQIWKAFQRKYKTRIIKKQTSKLMRSAGQVLQWLGYGSKKDFLNNVTTTIGKKIYIPFTIGAGDQRDLFRQVFICIHEHKHVKQKIKAKYLWSRKYRVKVEIPAYIVENMFRILLDPTWRPTDIVSRMNLNRKLYGMKESDIEYGKHKAFVTAQAACKGQALDHYLNETIELVYMAIK